MNTFYEHHKSSINFAYRCFDRILLNGLIQPFQQPERPTSGSLSILVLTLAASVLVVVASFPVVLIAQAQNGDRVGGNL